MGVEEKGGSGLGLARMEVEKSEVGSVIAHPLPQPRVLEGSPVHTRLLEGVRQNTFVQHVCLIYTHTGGGGGGGGVFCLTFDPVPANSGTSLSPRSRWDAFIHVVGFPPPSEAFLSCQMPPVPVVLTINHGLRG